MSRIGRLWLAFAIRVKRAIADLLDTKLSCIPSDQEIRRVAEWRRLTLVPGHRVELRAEHLLRASHGMLMELERRDAA